MAGGGFLQSLWEKPIWEGVWPYFGSDGQCVFTHSIHGVECASEVWPHGELFFFLIQKELATEQVGETFSPIFNADIRTFLFSADVLKKCALIALHIIAEEEEGGRRWMSFSRSGGRMEIGLCKEPNVGK